MLNHVVQQPDREREHFGSVFYPRPTIYSLEGWQAGWTSANVNGQLQRGYNTNSTKKRVKLVVDQRLLSLTMLPR